jgi:L-lactate dehydrogenase complex protein LldE
VRVALFVTCFNDTLFPQTGRAVVTLLERLGCEVDFPEAQTCCAQMHTNTGYRERGLALARRFERVFADAEVVVSPSASCVAYLRENGAGLDGRLAELTEFLLDRLGVEDVGATFPHRVALHPTCHSVRLMGIGGRPQRLLKRVRGIDLVELDNADVCCGFGGTFAVKNADTSMAMLSDKLRDVLNSGADVCTAADNSCLLQIGGALRRQRAATCARSSCQCRWRPRGRTSRSLKPARSVSWSPRATGACASRSRGFWSRRWESRRCCRSGATSRCSCSCCRVPRPASG